ncbi:helix-turn-helix domain-containing protein [Paenibacillus oralis]|uniref:Helix-turn-helix domain-containing protein n=1 Tax=Paenibacillus oralis TaxID=2490856 RepID=A0A3P3TAU3_9BACL|nr:helix-turn-helix transcriptional regulator [Paenibacillus oralis]RRJ54639.1 helix-turn-helix domain-containing protein [Paenibacillus oralis]
MLVSGTDASVLDSFFISWAVVSSVNAGQVIVKTKPQLRMIENKRAYFNQIIMGGAVMQVLAERIKEVRMLRGKTQEQLAEGVGASSATISNWERSIANPDPDQVVKLAAFLKTSTDYLLGITDNPLLQRKEPSTLSQIDYEIDQLNKLRESLKKAALEKKVEEYVDQLTEKPATGKDDLRRMLRFLAMDVREIEKS